REPHVLFALERLGRPDNNPELLEARADLERRAVVAGEIAKLLGERSPNIVGYAAGALPAWAVKENLPAVLEALDRTQAPHRQLLDVVGEIKDQRSAEVVGAWFVKEGRAASRAFQKLGPALAEKEVLKFLHHPDGNVYREARQILQAFKTSDDALVNQTLLD